MLPGATQGTLSLENDQLVIEPATDMARMSEAHGQPHEYAR
jgi:hypothetical protein